MKHCIGSQDLLKYRRFWRSGVGLSAAGAICGRFLIHQISRDSCQRSTWLSHQWIKCGASSCLRPKPTRLFLMLVISTEHLRTCNTAMKLSKTLRKSSMNICTPNSCYSLVSSSCPMTICCTSCLKPRTPCASKTTWTSALRAFSFSSSQKRLWLSLLCFHRWTKKFSSTSLLTHLRSKCIRRKLTRTIKMDLPAKKAEPGSSRPLLRKYVPSRTGSLMLNSRCEIV